jgi:hypothetical protein
MRRVIKFYNNDFKEVPKIDNWSFKLVTVFDIYGNFIKEQLYERDDFVFDKFYLIPKTKEEFLENLWYELRHDSHIQCGSVILTPVWNGVYISYLVPTMDSLIPGHVDFITYPKELFGE